MPIRAVCFDLGGVLAEICHTWKDAVRHAAVESSFEGDPGRLESFEAFDPFQAGQVSLDDYLDRLSAYLGLADRETALKVHNHILVKEIDGVAELAAELRTKGLKLGCMSNTNEPHWVEFLESERFPTTKNLQVHVASYLVGANKPDEAIYRHYEGEVGAVPDEIVFFDDNLPNVEGAKRCGWHAFGIDAKKNSVPQMRARLGEVGAL